ncbi:MAG: hypothetical protein ACRD0U_07485 [Acidimicrobiales bacterium]
MLAAEFALSVRRKPAMRKELANRLRLAQSMIGAIFGAATRRGRRRAADGADDLAAALLGLGFGLSSQRIVDPSRSNQIFGASLTALLDPEAARAASRT